jgi:hypothetical protein
MRSRVVRIHDSVRGWVDGRHPNACFVHLEKIRDQLVEVDVLFRIVEECELAIVT